MELYRIIFKRLLGINIKNYGQRLIEIIKRLNSIITWAGIYWLYKFFIVIYFLTLEKSRRKLFTDY